MTNLLEQLFKAKGGEGTSAQPSIDSPMSHISIASQNLGADSITEQNFVPAIPIRSTQSPTTVDLTADGPSEGRSSGIMSQDKISSIEEWLRAIKGNDWFNPI